MLAPSLGAGEPTVLESDSGGVAAVAGTDSVDVDESTFVELDRDSAGAPVCTSSPRSDAGAAALESEGEEGMGAACVAAESCAAEASLDAGCELVLGSFVTAVLDTGCSFGVGACGVVSAIGAGVDSLGTAVIAAAESTGVTFTSLLEMVVVGASVETASCAGGACSFGAEASSLLAANVVVLDSESGWLVDVVVGLGAASFLSETISGCDAGTELATGASELAGVVVASGASVVELTGSSNFVTVDNVMASAFVEVPCALPSVVLTVVIDLVSASLGCGGWVGLASGELLGSAVVVTSCSGKISLTAPDSLVVDD